MKRSLFYQIIHAPYNPNSLVNLKDTRELVLYKLEEAHNRNASSKELHTLWKHFRWVVEKIEEKQRRKKI